MQNFSPSPVEIVSSFWRNYTLIKVMATRQITGRYRGSFIGILWAFFNPLFTLAVYTFVFSVILGSRWNLESDSKTEFALVLFCGLIVFNLFAECINNAPNSILSNVNYVKKVVFPLEILPWVTLASVAFHAMVSWSVWLTAYFIFFGMPHVTVLFLPLVMLPLMLFVIGLSWWLASLGVYLRDASQFVGIAVNVMMFMSPIFYPVTAIPEQFRWFLFLNPLTIIIEQVREVMFWGNYPDLKKLGISLTIGLLVASMGFAWFQKTRKGFADVV